MIFKAFRFYVLNLDGICLIGAVEGRRYGRSCVLTCRFAYNFLPEKRIILRLIKYISGISNVGEKTSFFSCPDASPQSATYLLQDNTHNADKNKTTCFTFATDGIVVILRLMLFMSFLKIRFTNSNSIMHEACIIPLFLQNNEPAFFKR